MKNKYTFLFVFVPTIFFAQPDVSAYKGMTKEALRKHFMAEGAWKLNIHTAEYQQYIDSAIAVMPDLAYLYQQKAMPYFKQQKYEYAMPILDKAVELGEKEFIDYRAFMKCIFSKQYSSAIKDFERSKIVKGENGIVMDHTFNFYIGLCHLQNNDFTKALSFFEKSLVQLKAANGTDWVHPLDLFYAGLAEQELGHHVSAINYFDLALKNYAKFSDAEYYKSLSLKKLGKTEEAAKFLAMAEADLKLGYTINEDNSIYERYPYQIKKDWFNPN